MVMLRMEMNIGDNAWLKSGADGNDRDGYDC